MAQTKRNRGKALCTRPRTSFSFARSKHIIHEPLSQSFADLSTHPVSVVRRYAPFFQLRPFVHSVILKVLSRCPEQVGHSVKWCLCTAASVNLACFLLLFLVGVELRPRITEKAFCIVASRARNAFFVCTRSLQLRHKERCIVGSSVASTRNLRVVQDRMVPSFKVDKRNLETRKNL